MYNQFAIGKHLISEPLPSGKKTTRFAIQNTNFTL